MLRPYQRLKREAHGQAMIETALMLPLLLELVFNTINFGYFFLVALNITSAPHSGALYSVLGFATPGTPELAEAPNALSPSSRILSVAYLAYQDMIGAIASPQANATIQVCSESLGLDTSGNARCVTCSTYSGTCSAPSASPGGVAYTDPESPSFVLNRVDVIYTFRPILDQRLFNLVLLATPICSGSGGGVTCTFHRHVSMRVMN